jgi:hypothetical protein
MRNHHDSVPVRCRRSVGVLRSEGLRAGPPCDHQTVTDVTLGAETDGSVPRRRSSTERVRRHRERKRAEAIAGPAMRQPYLHAAAVDPLAAAVVAELLDSGDAPEHVTLPRFKAALNSYGRTEAVVRLVSQWVMSLPGVETMLAETTVTDETASHNGGRSTKRVVTKRIADALSFLERAERRAAAARAELLLSPQAAARAGMELAENQNTLLSQVLRLQLDRQQGAEAESPGA